MHKPAPLYEATLTLGNVDLVVQGRPGADPLERDAWELLATTTDEAHPAPVELDADEEKLAREALVECWCEAQRDVPADDGSAREEAAAMRRDAIRERDEIATMTRVVDLFAALRASARRAAKVSP